MQTNKIVAVDMHPDSFTAAILCGPTPAAAIVEKIFNKIPSGQLERWARKHVTAEDIVVMEASGNSFNAVRRLQKLGLKAKVLESCHLGKLKEAHANNDKISAVRIGKAYLAGTAKEVWVPDTLTQERRDWFHAHAKAVKRATQIRCRLRSYLSDYGVRLPKGTRLAKEGAGVAEQLRATATWTDRQWRVIEGLLLELKHADEQRSHWRSLMAQEVASDPLLLSLMRLCGVREINAFALGAIIGDIKRFASPKKLVNYIGLSPAFNDSGENSWKGGIGRRGRKDLRSLLIEAAHSVLRSDTATAKWARKLFRRKGEAKLVVAAVARKLAVAIWYLMMGKWTPITELDDRLQVKLVKLITTIGKAVLKAQGKTPKQIRESLTNILTSGRTYTPPAQALA